MIPDPKPLPSLRPLVVIGVAAVAGLLAHRWWKRRPKPVSSGATLPTLRREQVAVEVPWGVERPI